MKVDVFGISTIFILIALLTVVIINDASITKERELICYDMTQSFEYKYLKGRLFCKSVNGWVEVLR